MSAEKQPNTSILRQAIAIKEQLDALESLHALPFERETIVKNPDMLNMLGINKRVNGRDIGHTGEAYLQELKSQVERQELNPPAGTIPNTRSHRKRSTAEAAIIAKQNLEKLQTRIMENGVQMPGIKDRFGGYSDTTGETKAPTPPKRRPKQRSGF